VKTPQLDAISESISALKTSFAGSFYSSPQIAFNLIRLAA